jgi:hypothetical protein
MRIPQPGAHFDQLLRQTRWHHVQLSTTADIKANMMLTVPALLVTLIVRYVTEAPFKWAALTLIGFCLLTIGLAAYAAMPKLVLKLKSKTPVSKDSTDFNILFFGDFVHLSYQEYEEQMEKVLSDPTKAYEAQVRELYTMGIYLATRKFRFVRLAYLSFMAGFIASGMVLLLTEFMG